MGARGRHRRGQAGLRERVARGAHHAAGFARPGRRGNRAGGERRRARHPRAGFDPGADSARSLRRIIGGCAARAPFSPATRSKARAPSSSASAILTDPASLRASREELFALIRERGGARHLAESPAEDRPHRGRLARARAGRGGNDAQSHARGRGAGELEARRIPSTRPTTACCCWRRTRLPSPPSFPIRSRCCCRCRAAPRRSASPCATVSSPPISSRTPPRGRM